MNKKHNTKTVRLSDQHLDFIEKQPGSNFTEKFVNSIEYILETKKSAKQVKENAEHMKRELYFIQDLKNNLRNLENTIETAERIIKMKLDSIRIEENKIVKERGTK